jgi:hypothetical protein
MPPGPNRRAIVTMTWTKRTTRLLIQYLCKNGYPPVIVP